MRTARLALLGILAAGCGVAQPATFRATQPTAARAPTPSAAAHAPTGTGSAGGICYLISDSQIASIMGKQPLEGGVGFELGGLRSCNWTMSLSPVESAGIQLGDVSQFAPYGDSVSGVGEAAYWLGGGANELNVKAGRYNLIVLVQSSAVDPKTAAIAIARLALSGLR